MSNRSPYSLPVDRCTVQRNDRVPSAIKGFYPYACTLLTISFKAGTIEYPYIATYDLARRGLQNDRGEYAHRRHHLDAES